MPVNNYFMINIKYLMKSEQYETTIPSVSHNPGLSSFCEQCRACLDEQSRDKYNMCTLDFYAHSQKRIQNGYDKTAVAISPEGTAEYFGGV